MGSRQGKTHKGLKASFVLLPFFGAAPHKCIHPDPDRRDAGKDGEPEKKEKHEEL